MKFNQKKSIAKKILQVSRVLQQRRRVIRNKFGNCFWRSINCINSFFPSLLLIALWCFAAIYFTSLSKKRNYCVVATPKKKEKILRHREMTRGRSINFSSAFNSFIRFFGWSLFGLVSRWVIESYFSKIALYSIHKEKNSLFTPSAQFSSYSFFTSFCSCGARDNHWVIFCSQELFYKSCKST